MVLGARSHGPCRLQKKRTITEVDSDDSSSEVPISTKRTRTPRYGSPQVQGHQRGASATPSSPTLVNSSSSSDSDSTSDSDSSSQSGVGVDAGADSDSDSSSDESDESDDRLESRQNRNGGAALPAPPSRFSRYFSQLPKFGTAAAREPIPPKTAAVRRPVIASTDSGSEENSDADLESLPGPAPRISTVIKPHEDSSSEDSSGYNSSSPEDSDAPGPSSPARALRDIVNAKKTTKPADDAPKGTLSTTNLATLKKKLDALLPALQDAQRELEIAEKEGKLGERSIENVGEGNEHIEMNLGLGVLEEKGDSSDNEEEDSDDSSERSTSDSSDESSDEASVIEISAQKFKENAGNRLQKKITISIPNKTQQAIENVRVRAAQFEQRMRNQEQRRKGHQISKGSFGGRGSEELSSTVSAHSKQKYGVPRSSKGAVMNLLSAPAKKANKKIEVVEG